ncbi:LamG domain-containing protein [Candidatus Woesearchaeota archaeon]|nr:LamG domain-containing protein [Candidatus Woesearchaeota archaeon]
MNSKQNKQKIEGIRQRIDRCKKEKQKLIEFVRLWNNKLHNGEISELEYNTIVFKKLKNESLPELINNYNKEIRSLYKEINAYDRQTEAEKRSIFYVAGTIVVIALLFAFFKPSYTGKVVSSGALDTLIIERDFSESTNYSVALDHEPLSLRISGAISEQGLVRVYLDNRLLFDSGLYKEDKSNSLISGMVVGSENISDGYTNLSGSLDATSIDMDTTSTTTSSITPTTTTVIDMVNTTILLNATATLPDTEANISMLNETTTTTTESMVTATSQDQTTTTSTTTSTTATTYAETMSGMIGFEDVCVETCELSDIPRELALRIEIHNATLYVDELSYMYSVDEEPEMIEETNKSNASNIIDMRSSKVEIDKPVRWIMRVNTSISNEILLSEEMYDISSEQDVTIKAQNTEISLSDYNIEKEYKRLETELIELEKPLDRGLDKARAEDIFNNIYELNSRLDKLSRQASGIDIEGAVLVVNEREDIAEVEYFTEGPKVKEEMISNYKKYITISSNIHYENVYTYIDISESREENINVFWLKENSKLLINDIVDFVDTNNDGKIDRLEWVVPHLSNETYEISITVLNPYSYLRDGDIWTVMLESNGVGNLTISSPNAGWTEFLKDINETFDEMEFLNFTCGDEEITERLRLRAFDDTVYQYSELDELDSIDIKELFVPNYECGETAYFSNYMLKAGYATLLFEFANENMTVHDYAYDPTGWAYDEDGDSTYCTGDWDTRAHACSYVYDQDWDTWGELEGGGGTENAYYYVNYTLEGASRDSRWQVKDEEGLQNISLGSSCDYSGDSFMLRVYLTGGGMAELLIYWQCHDGEDWYTLASYAGDDNAYEEAMWWDWSCSVGTECTDGHICIEGNCEPACNSTFDGDRCSDDTAPYTHSSSGICARNYAGTWTCDKNEVALYSSDHYQDCYYPQNGAPTSSIECDTDVAPSYTANGICSYSSGTVNTASVNCDTGETCFDDTYYRSDCLVCYSLGSDWDSCDSNGGTSFSANGICIYNSICDDTAEACYDGFYYQDNCSSCGYTLADNDACDSLITDGTYSAWGMCASDGGSKPETISCDVTGEVCTDDQASGKLINDCSIAACENGNACDSEGGTSFGRDGRCGGNDCCTAEADGYEDDGTCGCENGDHSSETQCDSDPSEGSTYDGVCAYDGSGSGDEDVNCDNDEAVLWGKVSMYYDDCYTVFGGAPDTAQECDSDVDSSGYTADGICAYSSGTINTASVNCDITDEVCFDDTYYRADCSNCYTSGTDWDHCDRDGGTSYTQNGICVYNGECDSTADACYNGTHYRSNCILCGYTLADNDPCASDITGGSYTANGMCVMTLVEPACDTDEVCTDDQASGTLYGDCSQAACENGNACDSDGGTSFGRDGRCGGSDCCTLSDDGYEDDGTCGCESGDELSETKCDSVPNEGSTYDGICTYTSEGGGGDSNVVCDNDEVVYCEEGPTFYESCSEATSSCGAEPLWECDQDIDIDGFKNDGVCTEDADSGSYTLCCDGSGTNMVGASTTDDEPADYCPSEDSSSPTAGWTCDTDASNGNDGKDGTDAGLWYDGEDCCTSSFLIGATPTDTAPYDKCESTCETDGRTCVAKSDYDDWDGLEDGDFGICTGTSTCSKGTVSNNSNDYIDGCGSTGYQCDSDINASGYICTGVCASSSCIANGNTVALSGGTYYDACAAGRECDSHVAGCSYTRDGYCAATSCCTAVIASGETSSATWADGNENCSCTGHDGEICDPSTQTGPTGGGICDSGNCRTSGSMVDTDQDGVFDTNNCTSSYNGAICDTDFDGVANGVCVGTTCDSSVPASLSCDIDGCTSADMGNSAWTACNDTSEGYACDNTFGSFTGYFFTQEGTCAVSSCDTSGHICYDDAHYQTSCSACSLDYDLDNSGDTCDSASTSGGDYNATGMCTYSDTCTAIGSVIRIDASDNSYFKATCDSSADRCDSSSSTTMSCDGVCASNLCTTNGNLIALSGSTYYNACAASRECDSALDCSSCASCTYTRNGYCADTSCCTDEIVSGEYGSNWGAAATFTDGDDETCTCASGDAGEVCDSTPENGAISGDGICRDSVCDPNEVGLICGDTCATGDFSDANFFFGCAAAGAVGGYSCDSAVESIGYDPDGICINDSGKSCDTDGTVANDGSSTYFDDCVNGYGCDESIGDGDYLRDGTCISATCCDDTNNEIAYSDSKTDTTLDHCDTTASYGVLCDGTLADGISVMGVIASATSTCCEGETYFAFGSSETDNTPWENCDDNCTNGRTCYDIGNVGSGLADAEAGLCVNGSICDTDDVCRGWPAFTYYGTMTQCGLGDRCDNDVNISGYSSNGDIVYRSGTYVCCYDDLDYEHAGSGGANDCCFNGDLVADGYINESILCSDSQFYDCGNQGSTSPDAETNVDVTDCTDRDGYYCNSSNTWITSLPLGCGCTYGTDCDSSLCIDGYCRGACNNTYDGTVCSDDGSNAYNADGICTLQTGTGWSCDETNATHGGADYLYACADSAADYAHECDLGSLAGGYSANGVCGATSHATCCTDFGIDQDNSDAPSTCGTESTVCNGNNGDYCDDVDDGSWDAGDTEGTDKFRCDDTDNTCISCDSSDREETSAPDSDLNGDGNCEYACGSDLFSDEHDPGWSYDNRASGSAYLGCPAYSSCLIASSPACQAYDGDGTSSICSALSYDWLAGAYGDNVVDSTDCSDGVSCGDGSGAFCCEDDANENSLSKTCDNTYACTTDSGDQACCDAGTDCVDSNTCYTSGTHTHDADSNSDDEYCLSATWYDCYNTGDCDSDPTWLTLDGEICSAGECTIESCTSNDCYYCRNNGYSDCDNDGDGTGRDRRCCSDNCFDDEGNHYDAGACDTTDQPVCDAASGGDMCIPSNACGYDPDCDSSGITTYILDSNVTADVDCDGDNDYCNSGTWYDCNTDSECDTGNGLHCSANDCTSDCTANSQCPSGYFCGDEGTCQAVLADGATCNGETYEDTSTSEDEACSSGDCDNDGVGAADDGWCFTASGNYDGEDNDCEEDANTGLNDNADEYRAECRGTSGYVADDCTYYTDGDANENTCNCTMGTNPDYWNIGGDSNATVCCENTTGEWVVYSDYNTNINDSSGNPLPTITTDACCDQNSDCVNSSTCYANTDNTIDIDSNGDNEYCNSGQWVDCNSVADCDPAGEAAYGDDFSQPCTDSDECTEACTSNNCIYERNEGYSDCDVNSACVGDSCLQDTDYDTRVAAGACDSSTGAVCTGGAADMYDTCINSSNCPLDHDWDDNMADCDSGQCAVNSGSVAYDVDNDGDNDYCNSGTWYDCDTDSECSSSQYCSANDCIDASPIIGGLYFEPSNPIQQMNVTVKANITDPNDELTTSDVECYYKDPDDSAWNSCTCPIGGTEATNFTSCIQTDYNWYIGNNGNYTFMFNVSDASNNYDEGNSSFRLYSLDVWGDETYGTGDCGDRANISAGDLVTDFCDSLINNTGQSGGYYIDTLHRLYAGELCNEYDLDSGNTLQQNGGAVTVFRFIYSSYMHESGWNQQYIIYQVQFGDSLDGVHDWNITIRKKSDNEWHYYDTSVPIGVNLVFTDYEGDESCTQDADYISCKGTYGTTTTEYDILHFFIRESTSSETLEDDHINISIRIDNGTLTPNLYLGDCGYDAAAFKAETLGFDPEEFNLSTSILLFNNSGGNDCYPDYNSNLNPDQSSALNCQFNLTADPWTTIRYYPEYYAIPGDTRTSSTWRLWSTLDNDDSDYTGGSSGTTSVDTNYIYSCSHGSATGIVVGTSQHVCSNACFDDYSSFSDQSYNTHDEDSDGDTDYCNSGDWLDCYNDDDCHDYEVCVANSCSNNAPDITSLVIYPLIANISHNLDCNVTAVDDYNTSVRIEYWWYNNSVFVQGGNTSVSNNTDTAISTIDSSSTTAGELWNCTIMAHDGGASSSYNSTTRSIENTAPTQDAPTITPDPAYTNNTLTCNWNNVQDVDGDDVVNITNWYKNNQSIMVLYMPFEGGSNSTYTKDYSGYGNDGTVSDATWNRTGGKVGGGYEFDGSNDNIYRTGIFTYGGNYLTAEAWIKPNALSGTDYFVGQGGHFRIGLANSDEVTCWLRGNNSVPADTNDETTTTSSPISSFGEWYHIVCTWDGTTGERNIYVNGDIEEEGTTEVVEFSFTASTVGIGDGYNGQGSYFNGSIDEVRIYNYSLSAEQISANYQAGLANHVPNTIVPNETSKGESWKCEVTPNDGYADGNILNSSERHIGNLPPPTPTILYPKNETITNRMPNLNWTSSSDPDGDSVNYTIYFDEYEEFSSPLKYESDDANYIIQTALEFQTYWWKVKACDDTGECSSNSSHSNFTVDSLVSITLINSSVDFGLVSMNTTDNTSDDSPYPLTIENNGNVEVNVTMNATQLWSSQALNTQYFQYKADNSSEQGSIDYDSSQNTWAYVQDGTPIKVFAYLNWTDSKDLAETDILVLVPLPESPGEKKSTLTFYAEQT